MQTVVINSKDTSTDLVRADNNLNNLSEPFGNSGINNVGNTCYMNATIQAISHTYYIRRYLLDKEQEIILILLKNASKFLPEILNLSNLKETINLSDLREKISSSTYDVSTLTQGEKTIILNSAMTYQMIKLLTGLWSENCIINPISFRRVFVEFKKKFFFGHAQHDSHEAYTCIIQQMDEELGVKKNIFFRSFNKSVESLLQFKSLIQNRINLAPTLEIKQALLNEYQKKKELMPTETVILESYKSMKKQLELSYSKISEVFTGFYQIFLHCPSFNCGYESHRFEKYYQHTLHLDKIPGLNIIDCLNKYRETEILEESDAWRCDKCKQLVRAELTRYLWTTPVILVIQFVRFIYTTHHKGKDSRFITYPLQNLDIAPFVSPMYKDMSKCYTYDLYSVINHTGDMGSGHYYTYCLNEQTNKWYIYNDTSVHEIPVSQVVNQNAYTLFYIRQDMLQSD